jgi:hypothetical protein
VTLPPEVQAIIDAVAAETGRKFSDEEKEVVADLIRRYPELLVAGTTDEQLTEIIRRVDQEDKAVTPQSVADALKGKRTGVLGGLVDDAGELVSTVADISQDVQGGLNDLSGQGPAYDPNAPDKPTADADVLKRLVLKSEQGGYDNLLSVAERSGMPIGENGVPVGTEPGLPSFGPTRELDPGREAVLSPKTKAEYDAELQQLLRSGDETDVFKFEPLFLEDPDTGEKLPLTYTDELGIQRERLDPDDPTLVRWDDLSPAQRAKRRKAEEDRMTAAATAMGTDRDVEALGPQQSDLDRLKRWQDQLVAYSAKPFDPRFTEAQLEVKKQRAKIEGDAMAARWAGRALQVQGEMNPNLASGQQSMTDTPSAWSTTDSLSINELLDKPWKLSAAELRNLQVQMFEAGVYADHTAFAYDPEKDLSVQLRLGDPNDPLFKQAWRGFGNEVMRDRDKTWVQHLKERKSGYLPILEYERNLAASDAAEKNKRAPIALTDPAAIRQAGKTKGVEIGGRYLSPEEEAAVQEFLHMRETVVGNQRNDLIQSGTGGTYTEVDVDAELAEAIRNQMGVEAEATDVADQYTAFSDFISGPGSRR